MNWRRGLLLAAIHLAIAGSWVVWQGVREWRLFRRVAVSANSFVRSVAWQEEPLTISFDPCHGGYVDQYVPPFEATIEAIELPASKISGIWEACPARWSFAAIVTSRSEAEEFRNYLLISSSFCALLIGQWLFVGGLPLVHPKRWWLEPGAFITLCAVAAPVLTLPYSVEMNLQNSQVASIAFTLLCALPIVLALLAWFWWLILLIWKSTRSLWRLATRRPPQPAQP